MIVSAHTYLWFITLMTGLVALYWIIIDTVRLTRALRGDRAYAAVRDRIFGSIIGLVVGAIGVGGTLHFMVQHHMI